MLIKILHLLHTNSRRVFTVSDFSNSEAKKYNDESDDVIRSLKNLTSGFPFKKKRIIPPFLIFLRRSNVIAQSIREQLKLTATTSLN